MMLVLPSPYDKYVFCTETQTLYSIKTKKVNKITSYISQSTKRKYWNVTPSKYGVCMLHLEEILKYISSNRCTIYENKSPDNRFIAILLKDDKEVILTNSSNELLNIEVMTYLRQGFTASLYEKVGDYRLVPETIIVE